MRFVGDGCRWSGLLHGVFFLLLLYNCASVRDREVRSCAHTYQLPYDRVWKAVEELVTVDMRCPIKKSDKAAGYIETDWVHVFDTDGTKRWMIKARLKRNNAGTQVMIDKLVEMRDEESRNIRRYRQEKKHADESPASAWKKTEIDRDALEDLYRQLDGKLASSHEP